MLSSTRFSATFVLFLYTNQSEYIAQLTAYRIARRDLPEWMKG